MATSTIPPSERRLRQILAANVRHARESEGWSIKHAAGQAGIYWSQWQKIEAGSVGVTLRTLALLSQALDIPAWELLRPRD